MIFLALLFLGTPAQTELPEYPTGPLDLPPMTVPARPFRLVDLFYAREDHASVSHRFETRARVGSSVFLGGEATSDRLGIFLDTQRLELGFTDRDGEPTVEASFRAPRFLTRFRGERDGGSWRLATEGAVRLNADLEILLALAEDRDDFRPEPPSLEEFIATGRIPPAAPPTRELRSFGAGFLYQRDNHFEMLSRLERVRLRSEAGFDFDRDRLELASVWNRAPFELDATVEHARTHGLLRRLDTSIGLGGRLSLGPYFVGQASTRQVWEHGLLRFQEEYRVGLSWFARRFRFARASAIGARVLELQGRAHELGYNERRAYDVDALRRFRERLGLSPARDALEEPLEALYLAQIRARNVQRLGFEIVVESDALTGVDSRTYRVLVALPWPVASFFAPDESAVDFLQLEAVHREDRFPAGIRAVHRALSAVAFLNRELRLRVSWESFDPTPRDIVLERHRPARLLFGFDYALGR